MLDYYYRSTVLVVSYVSIPTNHEEFLAAGGLNRLLSDKSCPLSWVGIIVHERWARGMRIQSSPEYSWPMIPIRKQERAITETAFLRHRFALSSPMWIYFEVKMG